MRVFDSLRLRFRSLFRRGRVEAELDEELAFHLEELTRQQVERGVPPEEARQAALRRFGGVAQLEEQCRDQRRTRLIEDFFHDLRYAVRLFAKSPGFTAVALLSLALGIGANSAVFSLVETVILRELPVREPGALVRVVALTEPGKPLQSFFSYPSFEYLRDNAPMFSHVLTWRFQKIWAGQGDAMEWVSVVRVTEHYFTGLGASAQLGRTLGDERSQPSVIVLSYNAWKTRFHSDPAAIGRELRLGGMPFTIVGVMPEAFFGAEVGQSPDVYVPFEAEPFVTQGGRMNTSKSSYWLQFVGRLRPGISIEQAAAAFPPIWKALREQTGSPGWVQKTEGVLQPANVGVSGLRRQFNRPLAVLAALVAAVLLLACVNLSNFLLARTLARRREIALRLAVGASRTRLLRQMLTESLLLAIAGAALGLLFAQWSSRLMVALLAVRLDIQLNSTVLLYSAALAALTTLLFGLAPAVRALRSSLQPLLKEGSHQVSSSRGWSQSLLVVQVALSLVLTFAAALFVRTFRNLVNTNPGYDTGRVLVAQVLRPGLPGEAARQFHRDLTARFASLPGVEAVSSSKMTPLQSCCWWDPLIPEGYTPSPGEKLDTYFNTVAPDYFRAMGTRLIRGREFNERDTRASTPVAIVSESYARKFFPNGDAIGRYVGLPGNYKTPRMEIIGIAGGSSYHDLRTPIPYQAFFPFSQSSGGTLTNVYFLIRTTGQPSAIAQDVRRAVHSFDPSIPVSTRALSDELNDTLTYERLLALIAGFFGAAALGLAALGLYGVLSYTVTRRTAEIGVRVALGASHGKVLWLVMSQSLSVVLIGMTAGAAAALALSRYVESLLFGVKPADPMTIAAASAALIAVTLLAAWLPARRAARVDPVRALRYE